MIKAFRLSRIQSVILPALFCLLLSAAFGLSTVETTAAQAPARQNCNVLLMLDKSSSIGSNWETLRTQVVNLFDALGASGGISLGYWTFSNNSDPSVTNYNSPYHNYVSTTGDASGAPDAADFIRPLPENGDDILRGQTNYEQAFGYNNSVANNTTGIKNMRESSDVLVLLTDGLPNYPVADDGSPLDGNANAVSKGSAARQTYGNKTVIGSYVTNGQAPDLSAMNTTINGDPNDSTNIGPLQFGNIEAYLTDAISKACKVDLPDYSLIPYVQPSATVVEVGDQITFKYTVNNVTPDAAIGVSPWQLYDVTIDPSVQGNPLSFQGSQSACPAGSGSPYCGPIANCAQILSMLNGKGTCNPVPTGGRGTCNGGPSTDPGNGSYSFAPSTNAFYNPDRCVTIDNLPLGTQVCSMLALAKPTGGAAANRISSAACVTIGKTPLVQVRGGDVRVGRNFFNDSTTTNSDSGVYTSRFKVSGDASVVPKGRTFGSWVEYGILAPGPISRAASLSGYAGLHGGYDSEVATSGCDSQINRLTFANAVSAQQHSGECGYLLETPGYIPDLVSPLMATNPVTSSYSSPLKLDGSSQAGLYKTTSTNFEIAESTITKGKTIVVYAPDGVVTITGDVKNADDTYGKISEIPQLIIIAKDIKIKDTVARIDAWLIANGGENNGRIDTCVGYVPPFSSKVCSQPLLLNGPIMARQLDLWRTKVDLSPTACKIVAIDDCKTVGDPAEIINLPASSILWARGYNVNPAKAQTSNTIELPPYF